MIENIIKKCADKSNKDIKKCARLLLREINTTIKKIPIIDKMDSFRREMFLVEFPNIKVTLREISKMKRYIKIIRDKSSTFREFLGRIKRLFKKYRTHIETLYKAKNFVKKLPKLKDEFTVVIAGYPNVGKSTLLYILTGSKPKIASYPFTTKNLQFGYLEIGLREIQLIDTPGILDREKLNKIEKKAYIALKNVADCVLFLVDFSETCGYPVERQLKLYEKIKKDFKNVFLVATKCDLKEPDVKVDLKTSTKWNYEKIREEFIKLIQPYIK
jgi:nucleolar GTP-binding protein